MTKVRITQIKSTIGASLKQERNLLALGIKKRGQSKEVNLTPQIEGIIRKVSHLVKIEKI
ncbi:MAG: 50S ribosomal protein L30 [Bacteroidia bacterium]|nr:50S ribosomal protein L30 [Bacteroidia bacterium]MDW8346916.1 50S ribosomal protein L30 [Bacteroidia bacterium]